ncbi:glucagon [Rhinatrema bivittatum]|uniref:glucagon n=1 Tax=Rhinatrema bivittatum TaxID=194408 RepID=UPI001127271F|nr:glucagon [Rhinatrema bivittatum]
MKMNFICYLAGVLLMLLQGSWQNPLQDFEDKTSLLSVSQIEPLDASSQLNAVKRHSQGTFTSDYSKYLDIKKAQEFVSWLMKNKRNGGVSRRHAEFERHAEGTYTSDISSYLEGEAAKKFVEWLVNGEGKSLFPEETSAAEELGRRHADGSFTSEINKVLDTIATKEFINWLLNTKVTQRDLLGEY